MQFFRLSAFDKELKKLLKKYRSLNEDLNVLKQVLEKFPRVHKPIVFPISGLDIRPGIEIYIVKHFKCTALKGKGARSGIRIVYAYFESEQKIEFIEIYYKDKKDCDRKRILKYYGHRHKETNG